jgi:hypothetical protein
MILWWIYIEVGCCLVILAFQVVALKGKGCAGEVGELTRDMIVASTNEPNRVSLCAQAASQALKNQSHLLYLKSFK